MSKFTFLPSEKEEPMKEKTIVTQEEMNALDASIASRQDKQDLLDGNTKALAKHISDEYYCCNASKKTPGGIADCSRCAIGKAGYIECRNTGYYEIDSGRLGTSEYRDAHRKMLCTLLRIRLNCEVEPESTTKSKTVVTQPEPRRTRRVDFGLAEESCYSERGLYEDRSQREADQACWRDGEIEK